MVGVIMVAPMVAISIPGQVAHLEAVAAELPAGLASVELPLASAPSDEELVSLSAPLNSGGDDNFVLAAAEAEMHQTVPSTVPTTTTTIWVEPDVEPEGEWVDAGNGLALPDLLVRIRFCESTNYYEARHTVSSASGAYQFLDKSWNWYGHAERYGAAEAAEATPYQQDEAALLTWRQDGARPWAESRKCWDDPAIASNYASAIPRTTTTTAPSTTTSSAEGESESDSSTTTTTAPTTTTTESTTTTAETTTTTG